jgi:hypothetical protein
MAPPEILRLVMCVGEGLTVTPLNRTVSFGPTLAYKREAGGFRIGPLGTRRR